MFVCAVREPSVRRSASCSMRCQVPSGERVGESPRLGSPAVVDGRGWEFTALTPASARAADPQAPPSGGDRVVMRACWLN